ncbi:MAG: bifunctional metallophosphatase/5'-nucleotidase [Acidobacteria bacterium]|nr:bifunctional metallophosphatase/5'-nucleotidase [Acidobacteriota bacterium]
MRSRALRVFVLLLIGVVLPAWAGGTPDSLELTILYTNDIHAQVLPMRAGWLEGQPRIGGFAHIATLVERFRKTRDNVLLLSAGDVMTGPPISRLTKGEAIFDLMNVMGYDAMCLGNHELDQGWRNTVRRINQADFPVLAANIFFKGTEIPFAMPCTILQRGPVRIGIIGILGRTAALETINRRLVTALEFRDQIGVVRGWVAKLRPHVDVLILLAHEGVAGMQSSNAEGAPQRELTKDIQVASAVPGIDVLITGHAHRGVEVPIAVPGTSTLLVSTYGLGTRLGRLTLTLDPETRRITGHDGKLIPVFSDRIPPDPVVAARIASWERKVTAITGEVIGHSTIDLTRDYYGESPLGDLTADAFREAAHTDIAITNSGSLRADIPKGDVTVGEVLAMYPFENPVVRVKLSGRQVKALLEHGATFAYGVAQVSGLSVTIDPGRPQGKRITAVEVGGEPLDPGAIYSVATSDYLADGGDGYVTFQQGADMEPVGIFCTEAIIRLIRKRKTLHVATKPRIIVVKKPVEPQGAGRPSARAPALRSSSGAACNRRG